MSNKLRLQLIGLMALALAWVPIVSTIKWVDNHVAHGLFRDAKGRWFNKEDWSTIPALPARPDYSWLPRATLIAHALGGRYGTDENSYSALDTATAAGLSVLEVDIWRDDSGVLRCHHGPAAPGPVKATDCIWPTLLEKASAANVWLIVDIKTEFAPTAQAILQGLPTPEAGRRVIFQLYKPEHVALYARWSRQYRLAGPIVTTYEAFRSPGHIAEHIARSGIEALALPLERRASLSPVPARLAVLVHPIHNCDEARSAAPAAGLFVSTDTATLLRRGCQ
jgi:hypothetical protein